MPEKLDTVNTNPNEKQKDANYNSEKVSPKKEEKEEGNNDKNVQPLYTEPVSIIICKHIVKIS